MNVLPFTTTKSLYMKRFFTSIVAMLAVVSAFAVEADGTLHPTKDFAHWSIAVNGGVSQFDGDAYQRHNQLLSSSYVMWTAGIDVEYSFNPAWGVILNFQYMPYQGFTNKHRVILPDGSRSAGNYFRGNMYALSAMGSLNVLNIFGQYRKSAKWAWYINGGLGFTFYDAKNKPQEDKDDSRATVMKDMRCMSFPVGTQVEYNINKWLAVGLSAYYRFHSKDNFEAENYTNGTMNDGEFYGTASLRVKFCEPKKRVGGHVRNIAMYDYRKLRRGEMDASELNQKLDSLEKRVKALEDTMANNVLPRIAELEKQHSTEPDEDGDGVPDFRDREPNTPKGAFVNYWGESLPRDEEGKNCCEDVKHIKEVLRQMGAGIDYDMSVYYAFDKSELTKTAKDNIAKAAQKLKDDPDVKVELRGYCDFPGKADYNLKLSNRRVEVVKNELISKYGIDESRISMTGKGKLENPPRADLKNRRCDFYFYY